MRVRDEARQAFIPASHGSGTFARAAVATVLTRPHPLLGVPARHVDPRDPAVVALGRALETTMRASPACVGLAATQVGIASHVFCMDVTGHKKARSCAGFVVLVNARIVGQSELVTMREGCLSVPDTTGNVARSAEVIVEGYAAGSDHLVRIEADAFEARCLQHELDHLDGFTFVDRVADPARDLFARKTYANGKR